LPGEKIDLDALGLSFGDATAIDGTVEIDPVELGGQTYVAVPTEVPYQLDVSRTAGGFALRLRFGVELEGPCFRCLESAAQRMEIDVREVDQPADAIVDMVDEEAPESELESPYVDQGILDLGAWSRDALVLSLPNQIVCHTDCRGLCSFCGESLNGADPADHEHGQTGDPRWAKLRDLG
jgi:uncharacterized protein